MKITHQNFSLPSAALALAGFISNTASAGAAQSDWPTYNGTLTSERYSSLDQINTANVTALQVQCTYDTTIKTSFETGLVQVDGSLFGATEQDTFSINPDTCQENWRVHEEFRHSPLKVNRGVAVAGGKVFRGTTDGRVVAYDEVTGKLLWATTIADPARGETVPASPIAWNGMIFIGNAGGDNKGVKGRIYALDASTGKIVWEFYLVPKGPRDKARGPQAKSPSVARSWINAKGFPISGGGTWTSYTLDPSSGLLYVPGGNPAPDFVNAYRNGDNLFTASVVVLDARTGAYQRHFPIVAHDFHDWDEAATPTVFTTKSGKRMMAVTPKDGHLYGYDLASNTRLYREPVTTIFNTTEALKPTGTRFCPGAQGGAEWNGPAYDVLHDTILTGEVDWCATVHTDPKETVENTSVGQPWGGTKDGFGFGKYDDKSQWGGWLTASDAVTGAKTWQFKAPAPIASGITPTAGGIVLFGDMAGNFYAFDSASGTKLWSANLDGAVAGGVITYDTGKGQKIAVAVGVTSPIWPTADVTGKIEVLGLK
ncbi:PQQ-binding-like beta-propeller repeat protein [Mesorhizobium sp. B2-4-17]|uniref:outer membrane protein assembly factor BamB family protein n=1 Tax=Mesorhizobium sp. B2-4-17 TaxID=2589932 RepID=UPI001FEFD237|nr:PQQ-binding-like beta-propeller repeat protein [Mesorhizobium sp. B2-4-17]